MEPCKENKKRSKDSKPGRKAAEWTKAVTARSETKLKRGVFGVLSRNVQIKLRFFVTGCRDKKVSSAAEPGVFILTVVLERAF